MYASELKKIFCPYCGESIEIVVDTSLEEQQYIEDCQVCCRPIMLNVSIIDSDQIIVNANAENDV
ncbi:MAG: CPXCG motif-containing cysteine-rich protein [Gammaproteobacteria bacterium]